MVMLVVHMPSSIMAASALLASNGRMAVPGRTPPVRRCRTCGCRRHCKNMLFVFDLAVGGFGCNQTVSASLSFDSGAMLKNSEPKEFLYATCAAQQRLLQQLHASAFRNLRGHHGG